MHGGWNGDASSCTGPGASGPTAGTPEATGSPFAAEVRGVRPHSAGADSCILSGLTGPVACCDVLGVLCFAAAVSPAAASVHCRGGCGEDCRRVAATGRFLVRGSASSETYVA